MKYTDIPSKDSGFSFNLGEKAINNSIRNILGTNIGSVAGHPKFGSNLTKYLFEQINPLTLKLIEEEIRYSLEVWEPRINIINIIVNEDPDYNRILIKITYSLKSDVNNMEYEFIFKQEREI